MRDVDAIEAYLRELAAALRRAGRPTEPLVDEARAHLYEDAARIVARERCGDAEAARLAVERFGGVGDVVAASRKHARTLAASVARISSLVLVVVALWEVSTDVAVWGWSTKADAPDALLVVELMFTTMLLWRALVGRGGSRLASLALQLQAAMALALLAGAAATDLELQLRGHGQHADLGFIVLNAEPVFLLMLVQSFAGLRALRRQQATQVGQPSLPVEWQPPG